MTDKLKCPFCSAELGNVQPDYYYCPKPNCIAFSHILKKYILDVIIDGKKAQDALKVARDLYEDLALQHCELVIDVSARYGHPELETKVYMKEYDETITSITKQENQ